MPRHTITTSGTVTGGTFPIRVGTGPTGAVRTYDATIPFNATAAQVKAELEKLPNLKDGSVVASGGPLPGTPVNLNFEGMLKEYPQSVSIPTHSLTGTTPGISMAEDTSARTDRPGRNDAGHVATRASAGAWGN